MRSQIRRGGKRFGSPDPTQVCEGEWSTAIVRFPSAPRVRGDGMSRKSEVTLYRNGKWMGREFRVPQVVYRGDVRVLLKVGEL